MERYGTCLTGVKGLMTWLNNVPDVYFIRFRISTQTMSDQLFTFS